MVCSIITFWLVVLHICIRKADSVFQIKNVPTIHKQYHILSNPFVNCAAFSIIISILHFFTKYQLRNVNAKILLSVLFMSYLCHWVYHIHPNCSSMTTSLDFLTMSMTSFMIALMNATINSIQTNKRKQWMFARTTIRRNFFHR